MLGDASFDHIAYSDVRSIIMEYAVVKELRRITRQPSSLEVMLFGILFFSLNAMANAKSKAKAAKRGAAAINTTPSLFVCEAFHFPCGVE
jgi:hypothetical protein